MALKIWFKMKIIFKQKVLELIHPSWVLRVIHERRFPENHKSRFPGIWFPEMHFPQKKYWLTYPYLTLENQILAKYWQENCNQEIFVRKKLVAIFQ